MSLCTEAEACQENNFITWLRLAMQSHMKGPVVNSGLLPWWLLCLARYRAISNVVSISNCSEILNEL